MPLYRITLPDHHVMWNDSLRGACDDAAEQSRRWAAHAPNVVVERFDKPQSVSKWVRLLNGDPIGQAVEVARYSDGRRVTKAEGSTNG